MAKERKYVYNWPRPMVTVDAVVFNISGDKPVILLIKRGNKPFKGQWAFPGGFVEMDEELEDAVVRELEEETGLVGVELKQLHTFGKCGRDPRGRNITIVFIGTTKNSEIKGGDDAAEARWFDIDDLPKMGFDHNEVAAMAIEKLEEMMK
ncbi:MAG: NUDIX hydrolase [Sedimentisphaerales bacterium]|nr:NUDIX hydrolase [Sedimentisphaerales bacterium]